jgi:DNA repair protein RadD
MLELRDYQRAVVDSIFAYWQDKAGSPLIVLPTGGGKSIVIATLIRELLEGWPDLRILCVTHVKELLVQNAQELLGIWPFAPVGFYSAGIGRRDAHAQVIFGGVQTIATKAHHIGHIDLVLVDEAHLMPRKSETQYGQLLKNLRQINPDLKLVGLTATPYRMGEGLLHEGEGALFDDICYEKPIGELIEDGYLCRPISKGTATAYDMTGVGKVGGDYKQNAMQAAVDLADINKAVVDEVVSYGNAPGAERKAWLMFCSGVEHAYHMRDEIRSRGIICETVAGETPAAERDRILADFKAGRIRAVTNNSVMTTGTNIPAIDLIAMCRPTLSAGLYVQMAGRGLRLAPGKPNCLFLDFAGVVRKHGPIDAVVPPNARTGTGDAPIKVCPQDDGGCGSIVHASARVCPDCGFAFPVNDEPKITRTADDVPMLSKDNAQWRAVDSRTFRFHEGKGDKPPSVKVTYMAGMTAINEWLCPQHQGFAKSKSDRWWLAHGGQRPFPKTVLEWLERQNELFTTAQIAVQPDGKYWSVKDHMPGAGRGAGEDEAAPAWSPGLSPGMAELMDDDIPF